MAYFAKNGLYLVSINSGLLSFLQNGTRSVLAFYQVDGTILSGTPSLYLCPGKRYALKAIIEGVTTTPQWITTTEVPNQYQLETTPSSGMIVLFEPDSNVLEIVTTQQFSGIIWENQTPYSGQFTVDATRDPERVGYSQRLPINLSDCASCGCQSGYVCHQNAHLQGTCFGEGTQCRQLSGLCRCGVTEKSSSWFYFLICVFVLLFLVFVIFGTLYVCKTPKTIYVTDTI